MVDVEELVRIRRRQVFVPRKIQNLASEFREGIAKAMGVSPEDIKPEIVEKWVREWTRAFLTPEAFRQVWGHESPTYVELATMELIKHIMSIKPEVKHEQRRKRGRGL